MILILGASGYIGSYLLKRFEEENFSVLGTYNKNPKPKSIQFDFENSDIKDICLGKPLTHVIFSAFVNGTIDGTRKNWENSYKINVLKTKEHLRYCFENNIIPVYLSTDNVFDGERGDYREEDSTNPLNCYGKIKQEIEDYLKSSMKPYLILRLGRVFSLNKDDGSIIVSTIEKMKENKKLDFVNDQKFTPIYLEDLFYFFKFLIEKNHKGIFHLASCNPITHYEIAKKIKEHFKMNLELGQCTFDSLNLLEKRPKLIYLNTDKIKSLTGFKEKPVEYFIQLIN